MAEIRQELGIDVNQAIQALNNLDRRLEQFGGTLDRIAQSLRTFNTAARRAFNLGNVTGDLDRAATSTRTVVQGFAAFAQSADSVGSASQTAANGINAAASASQNAATAANSLGTSATTGTTQAASAFQRFGSVVSSASSRIRSSFATLRSNFQAFGAQSQQAIGNFTIGFQTLGRIISAQFLIRGINAIGRAFSEATSDAIDFQRQIAAIQTISQGAFRNFEPAAEAVRRVSDAFNLPLGEAGAGLYNIISDQIQGATNQINLLEQAAVLAKTGLADLGESAALLTSTINAFELSVDKAENLSSLFFRTADLGRTTVEELGKSFGTVSTLAFEAGVSAEELAAAFATITINGVDTAKAATQLRGILNALIKPTDDLQKVFEEAGFSEGALAVETLGLAGTLDLISNAANGSQAAMGKLIPRLRGITGQLILSRNSGEEFRRTLSEIQRSADQGIQEEFQITIQTDAERVTAALNRLSNVLTVDLGQSILKVLAFFLRFEGVINVAVRALQILAPALTAAAVAFGVYAVAAGVAAAANTAFLGTAFRLLGAFGGVPALLAAAFLGTIGVINAARSSAQAALSEAEQRARQASAERLADERRVRSELVRLEQEGIRDRVNAVTQYVVSIRQSLGQVVEAWKTSNDEIVKDTETVLNRVLDANKNLVSGLKKEAEQAAEAQIASAKRVSDIRIAAEEAVFKASLRGRSETQQAAALQERAADLGRKAAEDLAKARTDSDIEAALATAQRAQSAAQEAVQTAQTSGNRASITRALQTQTGLADQLIRAEQQLQRSQAAREQIARSQATQEEARVAALERAVEKALELQKTFDTTASPIDRKKVLDEIDGALRDVQKLSIPEGQKLSASDLISFAKFRAELQGALKVSEAQGINVRAILSGDAQRNLSTQIENTVAEAFRAGINRALAAGIDPNALQPAIEAQQTRGPLEAVDALTQALNAERDRLVQVSTNAERVRRATEDLATAAEAASAALSEGLTITENIVRLAQAPSQIFAETAGFVTGRNGTIGLDEGAERLRQLGEEAARLPLETFGRSEEEINSRLQDFNSRFNNVLNSLDAVSRRTLEPNITRVNKAVEIAQKAIDEAAQKGIQTGDQIERAYQGAVDTAGKLETPIENSATSAGNFQGALNQAVAPSAQIASNMAAAAAAAERAAQASSQIQAPGGGQTQNAAFGGMIRYFNKGGFAPRGTDTVPAMLSPGEFVVNAKSTRRFFSQLQAINAGVQPRFFQDGGPVTNINIGDIKVSSSDVRSGDTTGREIARSLKRELRRKTSSLRR